MKTILLLIALIAAYMVLESGMLKNEYTGRKNISYEILSSTECGK